MRHACVAIMMFACAPNGVAPAPTEPVRPAGNPGAFADPAPARILPPDRGEAVRGWVVLGRAPVIDLAQTHLVTTAEPFSQILVKAIDGAPEIEQIVIEYRDRGSQAVRIERKLVAGQSQVIELREKRPIDRIIVRTDPDSHGDYVVFGG
jgi:hypothetical protein